MASSSGSRPYGSRRSRALEGRDVQHQMENAGLNAALRWSTKVLPMSTPSPRVNESPRQGRTRVGRLSGTTRRPASSSMTAVFRYSVVTISKLQLGLKTTTSPFVRETFQERSGPKSSAAPPARMYCIRYSSQSGANTRSPTSRPIAMDNKSPTSIGSSVARRCLKNPARVSRFLTLQFCYPSEVGPTEVSRNAFA